MDLGSLLVIFALVIIIVGYIARPILERRAISVTEFSRYDSELQAERDQTLMNLQELDMDHAMGKIPADEYQSRRAVLVARGVKILRELDRLSGVTQMVPAQSEGISHQDEDDLEVLIEREIRQRRALLREETAGYCPQCGYQLHVGDRFCTSCGSKVNVVEANA